MAEEDFDADLLCFSCCGLALTTVLKSKRIAKTFDQAMVENWNGENVSPGRSWLAAGVYTLQYVPSPEWLFWVKLWKVWI